ncbi:O-antigen ligase family protein [Winogradskyella poriferorum]|uniref:O-antigen ligase family protein n=1 Tax=Winogradskyella poriferorum TaxID=307627 RepID=UPI003D64650A
MKKNSVFILILVLIASSLVMPMTFNNIAIGIYLLFFLFNLKSLKKEGYIILYFLPLLLFFVDILSVFNSENTVNALKILEKRSSMLIFSVGFFLLPKVNNKQLSKILDSFVVALIGLCLVAMVKAFFLHYQTYGLNFNYQSYWLIGHHKFSELVDFHATYFSNYILFALSILFFNKKSWFKRRLVLKWLTIALFMSCFMIMSVRTCFLTFLIIIGYLIFDRYRGSRKNLAIATTTAIVGIIILFSTNTMLRERFEDIISVGKSENVSRFGGGKLRMYKWQTALSIFKENPIFGIGNGDIKVEMDKKYALLDQDEFDLFGYNAHNQYLDALATKGVFGLMVLLLFIGGSLYFSMVNSSHYSKLLFVLILINLISFITENILDINKGIVFLFFFYGLLCSNLDFNRKLTNENTSDT